MVFTPRPMHDAQETPDDYQYVSSVSEGMRLRAQQSIHPEAAQGPAPIQRHRMPEVSHRAGEGYGTRTRRAEVGRPVSHTVMTQLPNAADGPAPAQSVAYPENYGIPDDPFHPAPETQVRRTRAQRAASQPLPPTTANPQTGARIAVSAQPAPIPEGDRFAPPVRPDVPDWLRVAQQNNLPLNRPEGPRVQAAPRVEPQAAVPTDVLGRPLRNRASAAAAQNALQRAAGALPRTAEDYEQAGYPPELLMAQQALEREQAAQPVRRRHGAQYAVNDYREYGRAAAQPSGRFSYPPGRETDERRVAAQPVQTGGAEPPPMQTGYIHPAREPQPDACDGWQVETDAPTDRPRLHLPWLGIAAFVAVAVAVGLWIAQINFTGQTQRLLAARTAEQNAVLEKHPLKYRALIEEKAKKYNLSPAFVAAIMLNESSFRPDATSSVDARGLMQLMDDTAGWIHRKMDTGVPYSFDAMYDAQTNVEYGCWYLNFLSERFRGDPILVAAAFHAGQGEVQNWLNDSRYSADGKTLALENMIDGPTKKYAARVLGDYAAYKRLYYETTEDDT